MDHTWKILGSGILIHTLELKLRHFEVSPYVCTGSHAFAMFAHKKNYGRAGYVDDPVPNIAYMGIWMPTCIVWLYYASSSIIWFSDHLFFCLVCGPLVTH